jgi:hypothetical protein
MIEQQSRALVVKVPALAITQEYYIGMKGIDIADQL